MSVLECTVPTEAQVVTGRHEVVVQEPLWQLRDRRHVGMRINGKVGAAHSDTDTSLNRTVSGDTAQKLCGISAKR